MLFLRRASVALELLIHRLLAADLIPFVVRSEKFFFGGKQRGNLINIIASMERTRETRVLGCDIKSLQVASFTPCPAEAGVINRGGLNASRLDQDANNVERMLTTLKTTITHWTLWLVGGGSASSERASKHVICLSGAN